MGGEDYSLIAFPDSQSIDKREFQRRRAEQWRSSDTDFA